MNCMEDIDFDVIDILSSNEIAQWSGCDSPASDCYSDLSATSIQSNKGHYRERTSSAELGETPLYLERLHKMLEECPCTIASWTRGGKAFAIYDPHALIATVLPQFFQPIKYSSFLRQLSLYRFSKSKIKYQDRMVMEYYHPKFICGQPELLMTVRRRYRVRPSRSKSNPECSTSRTELRKDFCALVKDVTLLRNELGQLRSSLHKLSALSSVDIQVKRNENES